MSNATLLPLDALCRVVAGSAYGSADAQKHFGFTSVVTDSRQVVAGSLFVALVGQMQDGHAFIGDALKNGASAVLVLDTRYRADASWYQSLLAEYPQTVCITVQNTLSALQDAAAAYVAQFPRLIKIGITGSAGKTTTKEILGKILAATYRVIMNEGNLNSETGLPLSVFRIRVEHEVGVFEMGMNRRGEIAELAAVLRPCYGVITNIGSAHIGLLGSRDAIAAEKKQLFKHFTADCTAVIPQDDDYAAFLADGVAGTVVRYGDTADVGITDVVDNGVSGASFRIGGIPASFPLPGAHNLRNLLAAVTVAQRLGLSAEAIAAAVASVSGGFGRSEVFHIGGATVIQDCYNANPQSMHAALDLCTGLTGRKIYVLGDMLELGDETEAAHSAVVAEALESASVLVGIGKAMTAAIQHGRPVDGCELHTFTDADDATVSDAAAVVGVSLHAGDTVLIKGSRGLALERVTECLRGGTTDV